jgi:tetratricopeptide (TPR) repeat protein
VIQCGTRDIHHFKVLWHHLLQGQKMADEYDRDTPRQDRQIRVFISSTFRDMQAERELLVKKVFPELRRLCSERFVTFTEVDLRWGITEEQAAEGRVLPICLEEIHDCRPYFIGLLGERYGWIPDSMDESLIEREPWLREHVGGRTSVTEIEILHGVLNNPAMAGHAFFYFRDPAYTATLPEEVRCEMVERPIPEDILRFGEAEAKRRTEERKTKLAALKERILESGLPVIENYADPEALAAAVRQQFIDLLDALYPKAEVPDPLDQEAMGHEAYARGKLHAYVERPTHRAALDAFADAESSGQGLVVTGASGGGKTALLASWVAHRRESHPDDFIFVHYFGSTLDSASVPGFLRRLLGELKRRYGITDEVPTEPEKMREALPLWISHTVGRGRMVLVLDGLNQVEGDEPDRHLGFLPRFFPSHVAVMASALPGPALEALRERGWSEHPLPEPDATELTLMIETFLSHYRKSLREDLKRALVDAPGAANPLFLRTVLEELRQFGSFEQLPERVAHYLECGTPAELFHRVIRRWQEDFDGGCRLVRRTLVPLWAARKGLTEAEWLELMSQDGAPVSRPEWRPLFLAMEPHLALRSGLYAFGHDFLRRAVEAELLPSEESRRDAHLAVADYFEAQPVMPPRKAEEWPWQLHAAEAWDRLEDALTDRELFLALYNDRSQWELTGYWHPLRKQGVDLGACYASCFHSWLEKDPRLGAEHALPHKLGSFLQENGCYPDAEPLLRGALESRERVLGLEHPDTLTSVNNLALLLDSTGAYGEAEPLLRRALESSERVLGPDHPDTLTSVNNLALLLHSKGDYGETEPLYRRALESRERVQGPEHPDTLTSLDNLAALLQSKGDYGEAEPLHRRALESREQVLGPEHPDTLTSVNNLALLLHSKGDYGEAEPLLRRTLESRERVLGPDHPDTLMSVLSVGILLSRKGDYGEAEPLLRRTLESRERVLGKEHPDTLTSLDNLAALLQSKGDYGEAEPLHRRALESCERVLGPDHRDTLSCVNNLALLLKRKGDYGEAETLYRRALESCERVLGPDHPDTLTSVNNLAALLESKGDYGEAETLYRRALESRERVLRPEHPDTLTSVNNLAALLHSKGDYGEAEPLYRGALMGLIAISHAMGREHPDLQTFFENYAVCLDNMGFTEDQIQARIHAILGQTMRGAALELYREGHYSEAAELLQMLLDTGFEVLSTRLHLSRIALVTDDLEAARNHTTEVWARRSEAPLYVLPRVLWLQLALDLLEGPEDGSREPSPPLLLGRLKSALQAEDVHVEWTMDPVLQHLQSRIPDEALALLTALVAALSDRGRLPDLDRFDAWREAVPQPLD